MPMLMLFLLFFLSSLLSSLAEMSEKPSSRLVHYTLTMMLSSYAIREMQDIDAVSKQGYKDFLRRCSGVSRAGFQIELRDRLGMPVKMVVRPNSINIGDCFEDRLMAWNGCWAEYALFGDQEERFRLDEREAVLVERLRSRLEGKVEVGRSIRHVTSLNIRKYLTVEEEEGSSTSLSSLTASYFRNLPKLRHLSVKLVTKRRKKEGKEEVEGGKGMEGRDEGGTVGGGSRE